MHAVIVVISIVSWIQLRTAQHGIFCMFGCNDTWTGRPWTVLSVLMTQKTSQVTNTHQLSFNVDKEGSHANINGGSWGFFSFTTWNSNFTVCFWWRSWPWTQKISLPSISSKYIFERIYIFYLIILCPRNCEWLQKIMWCLQSHSGLFHKGKANQVILQNLIKHFHINCCLMWAKSKMRLIFGKAYTSEVQNNICLNVLCTQSCTLTPHSVTHPIWWSDWR